MNEPPARVNAEDNQKLLNCRRCPRLTNQFKKLRVAHPDYWNRPVPASGPADARLLVVGLAPGLHGANKTGIPFTGDASGDLLNDVLRATGLIDRVRITNAVKCLPIKNLPSGREVSNCRPYLEQELPTVLVAIALGGVAHRAVIRALDLRQVDHAFAHGAVHTLGDLTLYDTYHCSRYNTQTGRLTRQMLLDVVQAAGNMAYP